MPIHHQLPFHILETRKVKCILSTKYSVDINIPFPEENSNQTLRDRSAVNIRLTLQYFPPPFFDLVVRRVDISALS